MQHEIELKLAIAEKDLAAWRKSPLLRRFSVGRAANRELISSYFDTPELDLKAKGIALRVRKIGARRIQTMKVPGNKATGFQHLIEYEQEIGQDEPDLERIDNKALQKFFARIGLQEKLTPAFTTEIKRRITVLRYGESEIEMALDQGSITAGERVMPLHEVEFELRSGHPADILDLALEIHGQLPFSLERRSKAHRGYALSTDETPVPVRASPVVLDRKAKTRDVFAEVAWNCIDQIRANELPVLTSDDPEGLHQLRVGIRRLRSLFVLYRPFLSPEMLEPVIDELAWVQERLGPARDWDVFVGETLARVRKAMPDEDSLTSLEQAATKMRAAHAGDSKAFVTDERYTLLLLRLFKALEQGNVLAEGDKAADKVLDKTIPAFAASVLDHHDSKVRKLASRVADLEIDDIHRLRLRVKKMRYAAEFFKSLFPAGKAKRRSKALAALQEALGAVNDAAVCADLLAQLTSASPEDQELRTAAGFVRGWYAALSAHGIASLETLWQDYEVTPCFWAK